MFLCKTAFMNSRISIDLGDPKLFKLLKLEAQETDSTMREVVIRALESYFAQRLETKALLHASESAFSEWDNPQDSDYDRL
jgi:hypothetical protein